MAPLDPDQLEAPYKAQDYRSIYMEGLVPADIVGALAQAAALTAWHSNHRFADVAAQKRNACRWCQACLPELWSRAFPANRSGRDHAAHSW